MLGSSLLSNMLTGKGVIRAGEGTSRTGYRSKRSSIKRSFFFIPPHPLRNFEIQMYYQNKPRFNGVYSRDNLPDKIKHGAYIVNLSEYHDIENHWVALYVNNKIARYFDSFGVEHLPKEIKKIIKGTIDNKKIIVNILKIHTYDSMYGYFCSGFIDFMFNSNSLTNFTNL